MRRLAPIAALIAIPFLLTACAPEPGTAKWCGMMDDKPKSEWSMDDGKTYASRCVIDSRTIGSEAWCEKLEEKPKEDWTAGEAADYAKHCVL
ncbi:MAG: DUF3012 domain-containing protein [Gammaproteobacteria bacterium]